MVLYICHLTLIDVNYSLLEALQTCNALIFTTFLKNIFNRSGFVPKDHYIS